MDYYSVYPHASDEQMKQLIDLQTKINSLDQITDLMFKYVGLLHVLTEGERCHVK